MRREVPTPAGTVVFEYERDEQLDTYTITFSGTLLRQIDPAIAGRALRDFALADDWRTS